MGLPSLARGGYPRRARLPGRGRRPGRGGALSSLREPEVIVSSNLAGSGLVPRCPPGTCLAAIDVEWSKNYQIRGGNVPFCYSVAWLPLPASGASTGLDTTPFWYTSAYVEDASQGPDLVAGADTALACLMEHASLIAGHQLCSDLAVLAAAAG